MVAEVFDRTIRGTSDLEKLVDSHIVVAIPYIATRQDISRTRQRTIWAVLVMVIGRAVRRFTFYGCRWINFGKKCCCA